MRRALFVITTASLATALLAGGALAGKDGSPLLLVPSTGRLPASVRAELIRLSPSRIVVLGGPNSVSDAMVAQVRGALGACHAGFRVSSGSQQVLRKIPNAGNGVALTFDMGGRLDPAVAIMNFLVANQVCATIFPTGAMSQTTEGQKVLTIVKAHPELFELGNHTMHHCDLVRGGAGSPTTAPCQTGGRPSADFIKKQLLDAASILKSGTGQNPAPYWRPPYGSYDQAVLNAAAAAGYTKTFLWDIDTIDWKHPNDGGPTAQQIASKVVNNATAGSDVLMHLGGWNTLEALKIMVPALRERGLNPTSLSDLLQP
jgi:peptidoglycan-N-acetylglucosamine deacetylase